ncbi:MAG: VanW family protein [Candidatus Peregrinibacteria bacterium]
MLKAKWLLIALVAGGVLLPRPAFADPSPAGLVLKTDFKIWTVNLRNVDLLSPYSKMQFKGVDVALKAEDLPLVKDYVEEKTVEGLDVLKLKDYLERKIAPDVLREKEDVKIELNADGKPVFTGSGLYGRKLDTVKAAFLLKKAIEEKIYYVNLPLVREEPLITISDSLKEKGIVELVSAGETDFTGSPPNRINNVLTGLAKFNGYLVAQGEEFVFGNVLGPVDEKTGYKKELVIKGDRTVPDYGGGLCQVSTTLYRAILAGGFPVTKRKNHTYAVSYYLPIGLDATVYPPSADLKFINDLPGALLMQSFAIGNKAYWNFYGTRDQRKVHLIGPYYRDQTPPPPAKTEYTTKLAPGEKQVLGHAVPGLFSSWYRQVTYADPEKPVYFESIYSKYQARPDFVAIGVEPGKETPAGKSLLETTY